MKAFGKWLLVLSIMFFAAFGVVSMIFFVVDGRGLFMLDERLDKLESICSKETEVKRQLSECREVIHKSRMVLVESSCVLTYLNDTCDISHKCNIPDAVKLLEIKEIAECIQKINNCENCGE